jgi:D-serine deaminase-like pyridoxal phosphate-dependent protein
VADSAAQIARLSEAAVAAGTELGVLIDIDLGQHRTGVAPADVVPLVRAALASPGLGWRGLQCYLGHLQQAPDRAEAHRVAMQALAGLVAALRQQGLAPELVTGGGTGTAGLDLAAGVLNELQAGSYAFMDAQYAASGVPYAPALLLATTVVSAAHKSHVTVDAGLKALAADGLPPNVHAGAPAGSRFAFQGDEHGAIIHPSALPALKAAGPSGFLAAVAALDADPGIPYPADAPREGDVVWLQPGHVDPTVNLHDAFWLMDEDGRLERVAIDARRVTPGLAG